ncbi:hypothetical protein TMatcc_001111 [Talaromyces marneffei ATCC 18224]|uniref:uncharacterized protein n=1 Tax=Talaromyces marneffei TaxID=37727 RepID=UPI0012AA9526|nr:uncharacterized protein EYB26_003654 [Talaromyces marneffei]KAE8550041.1 hypothetical protein EYB25_008572 [Talaromyces marneffei]QGA15987.1 hypothetical protein EYB26_003654 [Talaromyces marneffei]
MASTNNTFPITRYELPIPLNVEIANTKREFAKMQWANPGALVLPENGGYYLKRHPEGKVVAIASDRLCSITDNAYMSLIYYLESQGLYEEANDHMEDLRKAGIDADKLKAEASDEIKSGACAESYPLLEQSASVSYYFAGLGISLNAGLLNGESRAIRAGNTYLKYNTIEAILP